MGEVQVQRETSSIGTVPILFTENVCFMFKVRKGSR